MNVSTLTGKEIVELTVRPQEYTHVDRELSDIAIQLSITVEEAKKYN